MGLQNKLINMLYKVATGTSKVRTLLTPIGVVIFFSLVGLFIAVALQVDKFLRLPNLLPRPLNVTVSVPILSVGLLLMLWSILHFAKVKGTPVPFNPPPRLVTTGPCSHLRNPMLSGVFILLFGVGILFASVSLVFIFTPLFILVNVLELKGIEEPELERRLGKEYLEYKKRTPMFIPWPKVNTKK